MAVSSQLSVKEGACNNSSYLGELSATSIVPRVFFTDNWRLTTDNFHRKEAALPNIGFSAKKRCRKMQNETDTLPADSIPPCSARHSIGTGPLRPGGGAHLSQWSEVIDD